MRSIRTWVGLAGICAGLVAACSNSSNPGLADGGLGADASHDASQMIDAVPADAGPPQARITFGQNPALPFPTIYFVGGGSNSSQTLMVANSGTAPANQLAISITGTDFTFFNIVDSSCGTSLAAGASCVVQVAFGPANQGTQTGVKLANLRVAYNNGLSESTSVLQLAGEVQLQAPPMVDGGVASDGPVGGASITSSIVAVSGQNGGDGTVANPFQVTDGSSISISISYLNVGPGTATSFDTESTAPLDIIAFQHGCQMVTLVSGGKCVDVYTIQVDTNFDVLHSVAAQWTEGVVTVGPTTVNGVGTIAIEDVSGPSLTMTLLGADSNGYVIAGNTVTYLFTLSGVPPGFIEEIIASDVVPTNSGLQFVAGDKCFVTTNAPQCQISVVVGTSVPVGSYTSQLTNVNGGIPFNQSGTFNVVNVPKLLFVSTALYDGALGGFAGGDAACNNDSARPLTESTFKALLFGNAAATPGTAYSVDGFNIVAIATNPDLAPTALFPPAPGILDDYVRTGASDINCLGFTSNDAGQEGEYGIAGTAGSTWVDLGPAGCQIPMSLYCIEQ